MDNPVGSKIPLDLGFRVDQSVLTDTKTVTRSSAGPGRPSPLVGRETRSFRERSFSPVGQGAIPTHTTGSSIGSSPRLTSGSGKGRFARATLGQPSGRRGFGTTVVRHRIARIGQSGPDGGDSIERGGQPSRRHEGNLVTGLEMALARRGQLRRASQVSERRVTTDERSLVDDLDLESPDRSAGRLAAPTGALDVSPSGPSSTDR